MIMTEYLPILVFLILAFGISAGAIFSSLVVGERNAYADKNSTYECGFDPFDDSRSRFEVKFYLVAILFIIFDLEIVFLFPWAIAFKDCTNLFQQQLPINRFCDVGFGTQTRVLQVFF